MSWMWTVLLLLVAVSSTSASDWQTCLHDNRRTGLSEEKLA